MNHTFRLVWNKSLGMLVAVSDCARSKSKGGSGETSSAGLGINKINPSNRSVMLYGDGVTNKFFLKTSYTFATLVSVLITATSVNAQVTNVGFETGTLSGWTGSDAVVGTSYSGNDIGTWTVKPYGQYMAWAQASKSTASADLATNLGLTAASLSAIDTTLGGSVTNVAWLVQSLTLSAGASFSMAWQYIATDYVPYNDSSITSLVNVSSPTTLATVNNSVSQYALLGATNPGTGNYSTGSYGATGWQIATYSVATAGTYKLGFASFNLNDNALSPYIFVDEVPGTTLNGTTSFSPIAPNAGSNAPVTPTAPAASNVTATSNASGLAANPSTLLPVFDGGTLTLDGTALGSTYNFTITGNNGTVDLAGQTASINTAIADAQAGTPGSLVIANSSAGGALTLAGTNTFTGATTIGSGATLALSGTGSIAASSGVANAGTLDVSATTSGASISTLSGAGAVTLGAQNLTLSKASSTFSGAIAGTGGLGVSGGTETLTGTNTFTGATTIGSGATLALSGTGSIAASSGVANAGTLDVSATTSGASVSTLSGAGAVTLGAQNLTLSKASSTFSGVIGGTGGMTLAGGTQTLSGSNTYSGSTNLNGGTLKVSADNNMGATSGALSFNGGALENTATFSTARSVSVNSGGATFNIAPSTRMTLNGSITGAGAFTKTGLGTLTQTGVATLSNGTFVRQGALFTNGTLNSNVTVDDIGKLAGSGVINGAVNVSGILAPGNSPGMLTVTSTVTMLSGSTFQENIAGSVEASATTPIGAYGYYSYLRATGNSQFVIGPNVTLVPMMRNIFTTTEAGYTSPAFVPSIGQNFRMFTADGGVTGRFSTLTQPDGMATGTRMAVFYNVFESKSIDIRALPSSYALWLSASNENTRSAARALDQILNVDQAGNATTAQDQLMYVTAGQNATDLPGFVRGLAGEVHGALAAVQPQAGQWLQGSVARHLAKAGASAAVVEGTGNVANLNPENGFWIDLGNSKANWNGDGISTGFTSDRTQFSLGADVLREKNSHLGIGLSHSDTNVSADKGAGSVGESMGFIYGQIGYDNYWIDGLFGYGSGKTESQRSNPTGLSGVLKSTQDNNNSLVSLGVRTSFEVDGNIFEPFARVMWQQNTRGGLSEGSAVAALSFASHTSNGMRTLLGLSGNSKINDPLATTNTYQFGIALGQDTGDLTNPSTQASFGGMKTIISAPSMGRTFLQANGSFTGRIDRHAYAYAGISGESHTGKSDLGVNFGVKVKF